MRKRKCYCDTCAWCKKLAWDRAYYRKNSEKKKAVVDAYRRAHLDVNAASVRRYRQKHPDRALARRLVREAILRGDLVRGACEECGTVIDVEAHHDDYSKPLDVRWLCITHHGLEHRLAA